MTAAAVSGSVINWAVGGMAVSGAVTTVMGTANQINQDWINVDLKEADLMANGVGLIQPPPIRGGH